MSILQTTFVLALSLSAAYGQTFAQPVREVDRDARTALHGTCFISVAPGFNSNGAPCSMTSISGAKLGDSVPSGKILVVEDASATCVKNSGDALGSLFLTTNTTEIFRVIPLTIQGTEDNFNRLAGSTTGRAYYRPSQRVFARMNMTSVIAYFASCAVHLTGHLVDAQ